MLSVASASLNVRRPPGAKNVLEIETNLDGRAKTCLVDARVGAGASEPLALQLGMDVDDARHDVLKPDGGAAAGGLLGGRRGGHQHRGQGGCDCSTRVTHHG